MLYNGRVFIYNTVMSTKNDLKAVISVRFFTDEKCFGPGIAELLHLVDELHSLRAAAKSMEMAYSKAWTIIRNSEKALKFKLLDSVAGGKNGGGAVLTEEARKMLDLYDGYCEKLNSYSKKLLKEMRSDITS